PRARQQPPERQLDAFVKRARTTTFLVEIHQRLEVVRRDRTPVGAPRQRRQNLLRAGLLLAGVRRPTRKNLAHAARVLRTLGIERPLNPEEPYRGVILQLRDAVVFERLP